MARNTNSVIITGHLGSDPEIRQFQNGGQIATFNLAIGDDYRDKQGNTVKRTHWIPIVVYGNARVSSYAVISDRKMIFGASNVGSENGTLTVFNGKDGLILTRGCFVGSVDEFLAKSAEVHDDKTKNEYKLLIEVAKSRILGG